MSTPFELTTLSAARDSENDALRTRFILSSYERAPSSISIAVLIISSSATLPKVSSTMSSPSSGRPWPGAGNLRCSSSETALLPATAFSTISPRASAESTLENPKPDLLPFMVRSPTPALERTLSASTAPSFASALKPLLTAKYISYESALPLRSFSSRPIVSSQPASLSISFIPPPLCRPSRPALL